ncbi:unnamed protein product [Cyprideis torosa]|uniref:Threonylcarbamoyl-AMP synthase n=1 Tax=Cyprideis torosa TaxID=163714 RepID=A0A7R8WMA5_9CRUS|nr:unnamed protein product [Cyprideis torosa]CAG0905086.1 unnamed protein product [Cyprideis torosa]
MPRIVAANKESIAEAAALLQAGEIVVLPTETVYGLGANALESDAVAKIFSAKKRPSFNPLIVHVLDKEAASKLVEINDAAQKVIAAFWPGPLTLILPRKDKAGVSELVTAGLSTLAVRAPSHKVMREVMRAAGLPIAAPSANCSGEPSATTPQHAAQSLGEAVSYILAAGACDVGLESTVLDLSGEVPVILRPGAITAENLEPYLGAVEMDVGAKDKPNTVIKSPGQLLKHYAPKIAVRLNAVDVQEGEALLAFGSIKFMGLQSGGAVKNMSEESFRNLSEAGDLNEAAKNLFMMLRDLDKPSHKAIAVMNIPDSGIGLAINERLSRAAQK